ncbi:hypothetical protein [Paenibacillus sp. TH7-28]
MQKVDALISADRDVLFIVDASMLPMFERNRSKAVELLGLKASAKYNAPLFRRLVLLAVRPSRTLELAGCFTTG